MVRLRRGRLVLMATISRIKGVQSQVRRDLERPLLVCSLLPRVAVGQPPSWYRGEPCWSWLPTPTVIVGAEPRRPLVGSLRAVGRHSERRFGQDIRRVAGPQLAQGAGQVTAGHRGAGTVRGPALVLASPKM